MTPVKFSPFQLNKAEVKLQALRKLNAKPIIVERLETKNALEVVCEPYEIENQKDCEFEWEASLISKGKELFIKAEFAKAVKVSSGDEKDYAVIKLWGAD
jgi:hypothetical protein